MRTRDSTMTHDCGVCRSQHSDVEHPSLFVHRLYILDQIRLGKKLQAILSVETDIKKNLHLCSEDNKDLTGF